MTKVVLEGEFWINNKNLQKRGRWRNVRQKRTTNFQNGIFQMYTMQSEMKQMQSGKRKIDKKKIKK